MSSSVRNTEPASGRSCSSAEPPTVQDKALFSLELKDAAGIVNRKKP